MTWKLNPNANDANNFRDVVGNLLEPGGFAGAFSTGSTISTNDTPSGDTNGPCGETDGPASGFWLAKRVTYVQSGPDTVSVDPEEGAALSATVTMPDEANMTAVTLTWSKGSTNLDVTPAMPPFLTNSFAMVFDQRASQAELDQAWPAGGYTFQIAASPSWSGSVSLTQDYPPIPRFLNYAGTQTVDASADWVCQWVAYAGAAALWDSISLSINGDDGTFFYAPDECSTPKIELPVTASSITIPKGTFKPGQTYTADLTFMHLVGTNSVSGVTGGSWLSTSTRLTLRTTGGTPSLTAPKFTSVRRASGGTVELTLSCMAQRTVTVEAATDLKAKDWQSVLVTNAPADTLTVVLPAGPRAFYRAGQQ